MSSTKLYIGYSTLRLITREETQNRKDKSEDFNLQQNLIGLETSISFDMCFFLYESIIVSLLRYCYYISTGADNRGVLQIICSATTSKSFQPATIDVVLTF